MENTVQNPLLKCVTDRFDFLFQTTAGEIGIRKEWGNAPQKEAQITYPVTTGKMQQLYTQYTGLFWNESHMYLEKQSWKAKQGRKRSKQVNAMTYT